MSNPNYSNSAVDWQREIYLNGFNSVNKPNKNVKNDNVSNVSKVLEKTKSKATVVDNNTNIDTNNDSSITTQIINQNHSF